MVGCVNSPTEFTEFTEFTEVWGCCWLRGYGRMPYPPNLCASVPICGRYFSARRFCAFRGFCGNIVSHGFHRSTQMVGCVNSPTEFTEFTEVLGCCWQRGYGRMPYPPNLCASVPICGRCFSARRFCVFRGFCGNIVSHGFHRSTQMVCCVNSPTEFTEFTEVLGCCWQRGYGRMPYPPNLCASVPICGRYFSARRFCAFRAFCGNIVSHGFHRSTQMVGCVNSPTEFTEFTEVLGCCWLRGYGRMPYPPNLCASVRICGSHFSARRFRVFCAFCGRFFSTRRVRSVGGTSQPEE